VIWVCVSAYLAVTAIFYAGMLGANTERRLDALMRGYVAAAVVASLVGPRPHAVQGKLQSRLFDEAVDGYFARHRVKPGITGWAQINGWRGEVDTDEKIQKRVEFDLYYIENWSVLFDLYILLKTPLALMTKSENAY